MKNFIVRSRVQFFGNFKFWTLLLQYKQREEGGGRREEGLIL
jgi:hypothetical protein